MDHPAAPTAPAAATPPADFWKRKLAAFLHDPPTKCLAIPEHREKSICAMKRAGFDDEWIGKYPPRSSAPWHPPEPLDLGPVLAPVEEWRLLANEQPPEISTPSRRHRSKPLTRQ